ncbi:uncharacterized protein DUF3237 [Novosphingobium sp. PhB55]|uniref:DUF3237 domain-containing protein n=1 Tax=Novosphingobium sp. PhB55 TaxID=2485106 RepID=UPI0010655C11|nr:DUF3237 domain-containing protein [Novosphingobium sp. PhB55]TDW67448.1 uncharacterized protein DUF3237 [Novosphingobium sp. PhB55]
MSTGTGTGPAAPAPTLAYAFSARVELLDPIDHGIVEGRRRRFVPISGGTVSGPDLEGVVLPGGGDWQAIGTDGSTLVDAHYALQTSDGTIIDVRNAGVRVASVDVSERIARGEPVDPGSYYFRTAPRFEVRDGPHAWLRQTMFIARGVRHPEEVVIDFYRVE